MTVPRLSAPSLLALLILGGCATTTPPVDYEVRARAVATSPTPPTGTYRFVGGPADPGKRKIYEEAFPVIRRALAGKGLREAAPAEPADWSIELSWGLGNLRRREKFLGTEPIFGWEPGPIRVEPVAPGSSLTRVVRDPPTVVNIGHQEVTQRTVLYTKFIALRGLPAVSPVNASPTEGWAVEVLCDQEGGSMQNILPVLTSAAAGLVGRNVPTTEIIHLQDNHPEVARLRKGP